jgi:hypothetical protein
MSKIQIDLLKWIKSNKIIKKKILIIYKTIRYFYKQMNKTRNMKVYVYNNKKIYKTYKMIFLKVKVIKMAYYLYIC